MVIKNLNEIKNYQKYRSDYDHKTNSLNNQIQTFSSNVSHCTLPTASNLEILILGSIQIYSLNDDVLSLEKYIILFILFILFKI